MASYGMQLHELVRDGTLYPFHACFSRVSVHNTQCTALARISGVCAWATRDATPRKRTAKARSLEEAICHAGCHATPVAEHLSPTHFHPANTQQHMAMHVID